MATRLLVCRRLALSRASLGLGLLSKVFRCVPAAVVRVQFLCGRFQEFELGRVTEGEVEMTDHVELGFVERPSLKSHTVCSDHDPGSVSAALAVDQDREGEGRRSALYPCRLNDGFLVLLELYRVPIQDIKVEANDNRTASRTKRLRFLMGCLMPGESR